MTNDMIRIWVHCYFSTKDVMPMIKQSFEQSLHSRIKSKLTEEYKYIVQEINGTDNHIHFLALINPVFSFSDVLKNVKGESSHWINGERFIEAKFAWCKSYNAHSVSEDRLKQVAKYIRNQKETHKNITYKEEVDLFRRKLNLLTY